MAFPFIFEANFSAGTTAPFDAESDSDAKLAVRHYSDIARFPGLPAPFHGAHAMHVDISGGTADAYLQETGDFDMTAGTNEIYCRFMLWVDPNLTMATTNEFAIMQFWSATNTVEAGIYINFTTANGFRIGIGEASASSFLPLPLGKWVSVETFFDPAGGSASTIDLWLDDAAATQVASFTSADITSAVFGTIGLDAGTTAGHILFDSIVADDARIYAPTDRFKEDVLLTASDHAFVGPGAILDAALLAGAGTDCTLDIYDTDRGNTNDALNVVHETKNTANNETVNAAGLPVRVRRGAYVVLGGTNPRARLAIGGMPAWGSDGAIRSYGLRRKEQPV